MRLPAECSILISSPTFGESNPAPGKLKWKVKVEDSHRSDPAVVDGIVYYGTEAGQLYAVEAETGQGLWVSGIGDRIRHDIAVLDGVIYIGSNDKHIYAVDSRMGQKTRDLDAGNTI